jgi:farnesyl diphosphate synthase
MKRIAFDAWMRAQLDAVEAALGTHVRADAPAELGLAMRYGVLDGGKRLRPLRRPSAVTRKRRCGPPVPSS